MKKQVLFGVVFLLLIPFTSIEKVAGIERTDIEKTYELSTFSEFKEMVKDFKEGKILIENLEKFGIKDDDEGIIIKVLAGMYTSGNGFAVPTGYHFSFFTLLPVIWYYTTPNSSTTFYSFMGTFTYPGEHIGGALIYPIGMWVAPRLLSQPGNIFGFGVVAIAFIYYPTP